ncbi:hypothetical protein U1Q18_052215 [Sarracenia purpurea var. burkii]
MAGIAIPAKNKRKPPTPSISSCATSRASECIMGRRAAGATSPLGFQTRHLGKSSFMPQRGVGGRREEARMLGMGIVADIDVDLARRDRCGERFPCHANADVVPTVC